MRKTTSSVLFTLLLGAGLAGCDSGPSAQATPSASASANRQQLLALGQEWVKCLRDKGLTRMPDAKLSPEGYLQFEQVGGYNWKEDLGTRQSIIDACKSIEDRYPPNAFRPKQQLTADDLRKLREFAECVREHGVPAFPDPGPDGGFDLEGTPLENEPPPIDDACRKIWSDDIKISGGGGKNGGKK
jgi:hypothetical protein